MINKKLNLLLIAALSLAACNEEKISKNEINKITVETSKTNIEKELERKELIITPIGTDVKNSIDIKHQNNHQFDKNYTDVKGILTFRGNNHRDQTSVGVWKKEPTSVEMSWSIQTGWNKEWGGGAGWTGQPLIIEWKQETLKHLGVFEEFKTNKKLTEVIQASLDGNVYFIELETGKKTRNPIIIGNPIKGTASLDSRGYPLLFVGEGIPQNKNIGMNIINLITNEIITKIPGMDGFANRGWGAFDGSPLISKETDTMVTNGENGIIYNIKLNTKYDEKNGTIDINPQMNKMTFSYPGQTTGLESSIVAEGSYLFTADNKGMVQSIDSKTMKTLWSTKYFDDSDSTMLYSEEENNENYLYTATEIDKQGSKGIAKIRKINAASGDIVWEKDYNGHSIIGKDPVNGGFLASPLKGQGKLKGQIFFTMARGENLHSGYMISLDQKTGEELSRWEMANYAWSSPAGIQDKEGNFYIVQMDSVGNVFILKNGDRTVANFNVGANVEASPIIYENYIIFASRGGQIYSYKIK
jgi:hypothetical protein